MPMGKMTPKQIIDAVDAAKTDRGTLENHWQEIGEYINPRKATATVHRTAGDKRNQHLLDNTAMHSMELLAGALHGLLTNPNSEFFELTTGNFELDNDEEVGAWLQDSATRMHRVLNNSNFQTEIHELYLDLTSFCTSAMTMEEDEDMVVRFATRFIANVYLVENYLGVVDTVYYCYKWDARRIIQAYGEGKEGEELKAKVGKKVYEAYMDGKDEKFEIIHAVYPNKTGQGMKVFSDRVLKCDEMFLSEKGFKEHPWITPRWSKLADETYGRGPGTTALPEAKTVNKMTETILRASQKAVDPPLQLPDEGFVLPVQTRPGGLTFRRADANPDDKVEPIYNDEIRVDFGFEAMEQHRKRIREAFFVDQLQLNNGPQMTATEVLQRTEERMRLLGPLLGRMHHELLKPIIDRLFRIMYRKNMFAELPQPLADADIEVLDVHYSSMIARTQQMAEGQAISRTVQLLAPFIEMDQEIADNWDGDELFKVVADAMGFPKRTYRSKRQVSQIREGRDQARKEVAQNQDQIQKSEAARNMASLVQAGRE